MQPSITFVNHMGRVQPLIKFVNHVGWGWGGSGGGAYNR